MILSFGVGILGMCALQNVLDEAPRLAFFEKLDTGAYRYYWVSSPSSCDSRSVIAGVLLIAAVKGVKEVQDIFSGNVYTSKGSVWNKPVQLLICENN